MHGMNCSSLNVHTLIHLLYYLYTHFKGGQLLKCLPLANHDETHEFLINETLNTIFVVQLFNVVFFAQW